MKIPRLPDNIRVHPSVWRALKEIEHYDSKKARKIIQRIVKLGSDPIPDNIECKSESVRNLKKMGIDIKRLKCSDILEYRIFYAYKKSGMVCIYCIVPRNEDTYKKDSWHYQIVKLLYTQWRECQ